jgi:hypothetical protein
MKPYGGSGGTAPPFLTSALDGDGCLASRPAAFPLGSSSRRANWIGGLVGLRAGLDTVN